MGKSITQLGKEWQAAQNLAQVVGGQQAAADVEKARQALAAAVKGRR
ncbi:hypothetical protein [Micromonospora sp. 15K316]|nr:hypothetical protein [Micromonospora sp. 15K316]